MVDGDNTDNTDNNNDSNADEINDGTGSLLGGDGDVDKKVDDGKNSDESDKGSDDNAGKDDSSDSKDDDDKAKDAPETYADFVMPEGIEMSSEALDSAIPVFKELGLTQEQAQKLVDLRAEEVRASQKGQVDSFVQMKKDWGEEAKNDSDIGGDGFDENLALGNAAINSFGTPALKKLLDESGVGNHVEMIRFASNVGRLTKEDNPGTGTKSKSKEQGHAATLYPKNDS